MSLARAAAAAVPTTQNAQGPPVCVDAARKTIADALAHRPERSDAQTPWAPGTALRRRREQALRCPPMGCGHQDPLTHLAAPYTDPGTFGLGQDELRRHGNRLVIEEGWQLWEVTNRLAIKPRDRAA